MIDYADREVRHRAEVVMVSPHDIDDELGILPHAVGTAEIDRGYYTDDREAAYLDTSSWDAYAPYSWLRIYHIARIGDREERIERGTYAIRKPEVQAGAGRITFSLALMSAIGALSEDYDAWPMAIGQGARASASISAICLKCKRPYVLEPSFDDYLFRSSLALEAGKPFRSRLYEICSATGNRMTVDSHGRLTFSKYIPPRERDASLLLDADDPRSSIIDGSIALHPDAFSRPSRSVVVYRDGDRIISAQADLPAESEVSAERRGYMIAELHQLVDMGDPKTVSHAQQLAREYLADGADPAQSWELQTLWMPLDQGDVVSFAPRSYDPMGDGSPRKCLVQTVEESETRLKLTLKEV